jgi:type I restriction enzyme S subunit
LTNKNVNGDLPKRWKLLELKDLVERISDGPFGSNLKSIDYVDKGVRVIRLENIGEMEFRDEYKTFVTPEKYETIKRYTVGKGDIIFSSFIIDSIRSVILPNHIDKAINKADCFLVRVSETKIIKKYLAFYFSTKAMQNQLVNQIHGATRPRINTTQLKASMIPFAPLEEQKIIVQEIESRLSVCDKVEETINNSLLQAETLRQSILKKAFEGRLQ